MSPEEKVTKRMIGDGTYGQIIKVLTEAERMSMSAVTQPKLPRGNYMNKLGGMIDQTASLIAPYTPCKAGCSACCHMAVTITEAEAQRIAKATGLPYETLEPCTLEMAESGELERRRLEAIAKYTTHACPFLMDNKCSIYEVRPTPCRLYHTIHTDNSLCQHDGQEHLIPAINLMTLEIASVAPNMNTPFGDIREFFPNVYQGALK